MATSMRAFLLALIAEHATQKEIGGHGRRVFQARFPWVFSRQPVACSAAEAIG